MVRRALGIGDILLIAGAGYGKTSIREESLSGVSSPVAWVSCSVPERASGVLLLRILDEIARVAPGASEALAERLAAATEQVDVLAATRELLAELPRLLRVPAGVRLRRLLRERDVPDHRLVQSHPPDVLAKNFGVSQSAFDAWSRATGIVAEIPVL